MPPKPKFSRDEIINTAFQIVRTEGSKNLTARRIADTLESSPRPIFTLFSNMDEVESEVILKAKKLYKEYIVKGLSEKLAFKGVGIQYILFAIREPKLFQLLFMTEREESLNLDSLIFNGEYSYRKILESIMVPYGLNQDAAQELYRNLWIYTHGIATLCASNMCNFTPEDLSRMMTEVSTSLLSKTQTEL